jgi:hypothetical protein
MAKRTKTTKTPKAQERNLNLPGFDAEASLGPSQGGYQGRAVAAEWASTPGAELMLQLGLGSVSGGDVGEYLRCRANGGGELVCRFFAGLPPFTIGGLFF